MEKKTTGENRDVLSISICLHSVIVVSFVCSLSLVRFNVVSFNFHCVCLFCAHIKGCESDSSLYIGRFYRMSKKENEWESERDRETNKSKSIRKNLSLPL